MHESVKTAGRLCDLRMLLFQPDVVFASSKVARPVTRLPEAISIHLPSTLAERSVTVRSAVQVEVTQLLQVSSHDLWREEEEIMALFGPLI